MDKRTHQKKALMACVPCRSKKKRCDGFRPVCGTCSRNGWTEVKCIWKRVDGRDATVPELMIKGLQNRIRLLEQRTVADQVPHQTAAEASCANDGPASSLDETLREHEPRVNAMVAAITGEPQYEGFLGSSSAAGFMADIRRAVESKQGQLPVGASNDAGSQHEQAPDSCGLLINTNSPGAPHEYSLPSRQITNALLHLYWTFIHPLYPILNHRIFYHYHHAFWAGTELSAGLSLRMKMDRNAFVCMLNLVMALGCQYSDQLSQGDAFATAELFFRRARGLFHFDPISSSTYALPQLQIMLLMAQYLQGTGRTYKAWNVIAVAIRICHQLGLHLATVLGIDSDIVERELGRRVYHCCAMTERILCMTLGRPVMISQGETDSVPLPLEIDDDCLDQLAELNPMPGDKPTPPSTMSFFVHSALLYRTMQRIMRLFSTEDSPKADDGWQFSRLQFVLELDNELMKLRERIPPHLRLKKPDSLENQPIGEREVILYRQSVVLCLRHLQARIYLFRPILVHVCSADPVTDIPEDKAEYVGFTHPAQWLHHRTALQCSFLCVNAAQRLINLIYEDLGFGNSWGRKPNWLYGVLHVYLSATVLIAARLRPMITLNEISDRELEQSWHRALKILDRFQSDSIAAQHCVVALKTLYQKLPLINNSENEVRGGDVDNPNITYVPESTSHYGDYSLNLISSIGQMVDQPLENNQTMSDILDMSWFNDLDFHDELIRPEELLYFGASVHSST